ncbi:MAG: PEPxxWA-CTERM sorting domain-containing protein [Sphingomonadales bacterium]|nr:PEPxxWA-CTERM sorting domain-containing protein [Sphingomonadales bacterium]
MYRRSARIVAAALSLALTFGATSAHATAVLIGTFSGNECAGVGGFSNCYAFPNGTTGPAGAGGSPAIFKWDAGGANEISTRFPSVTGSEFTVNYTGATNSLSFSYNPGANDPAIHYYAVFQAGTTKLFHDSAAIVSGTVQLTDYFPNNPGISHITFFDTGTFPVLPEPSTWASMILGFGFVAQAMRARTGRKAAPVA